MKARRRFIPFVLTLALAFLTTVAPLLPTIRAQETGQPAAAAVDLTRSLAAIEKSVDDKRKELGIPGVSLVIVKDDRVIFMKGLGVKDFERQLPVTADTLFAIGSSSKAFTALAAVISADEGKLSLDDSPKKLLPYFKLRDPEADAKITIRDLLSHRSGLNRTDLAMVTGKLNREELIKVAGMAKPTAKLGEKFQYQNIMYAAAGEAVARAQNSTWDQVVADKIFKPLGMKATVTTVAAMEKSRDFSLGYDYNATTKTTRHLPMREIPAAAPAGAINSNVRDMAQWLRFMLAGGVFNNQRLVSEKGFNELLTKQINVGGKIDYGLGWFLREWDGHKVVEHGGNIDGFNAQVALMPDQKLGFVMLTNVTASPLGAFTMNTVWTALVGQPDRAVAVADQTGAKSKPNAADGEPSFVLPEKEAGTYHVAEAGVDMAVTFEDGKLNLSVPGQPTYPLENIGGRRYKLTAPAPDGFFATFRPVKGKESETELYLEQPQGNVVLQRVAAPGAAPVPKASVPAAGEYAGPLKDVIGSYEQAESKGVIEVTVKDDKVVLAIPGQSPYPLVAKEKDKLGSTALPDTYWVDIKRDASGKITGIVINQPEGQFPFRRLEDSKGINLSVDELLTRIIAAYGGETSLRKHTSSTTQVDLDFESEGVTGTSVTYAKAPNLSATNASLTALGKEIGSIATYFDGSAGGEKASFGPEDPFTGKHLEDVRRESDFYGPLDWKKNFKTIVIKRTARVGDEDALVLELTPEKGHAVTLYISTRSFLPLRRDSTVSSETSGLEIPQTQTLSDYRLVDGLMVPFKIVTRNIATGEIVARIKDVKFDQPIPDAVFHKPIK